MPACQQPVSTCQDQSTISETERILDKLLEWSNSDEEAESDSSVTVISEENNENTVPKTSSAVTAEKSPITVREKSPENSLDDFDTSPLKADITPDRKKRSPGTQKRRKSESSYSPDTPSSTKTKRRTMSTSPGTPSSTKRNKTKPTHSDKDKLTSPVAGRYKTRSRGGNAPRQLSYQDIPHFSSDSDFESSDSGETEADAESGAV